MMKIDLFFDGKVWHLYHVEVTKQMYFKRCILALAKSFSINKNTEIQQKKSIFVVSTKISVLAMQN